MQYVKVADLKPASYNPRRIGDREFDDLCRSLETLGCVVPVIVNPENMTLIAGHQRSKAAAAIGLEELPCFYASNVKIKDEVMFNQLHNGTDFDKGFSGRTEPYAEPGWTTCAPSDNHVEMPYAALVAEVVKLVQKYGNILSAVVTMDGEVVSSSAYMHACRVLNIEANVYVLERSKEEYARAAFKEAYGSFSYDHIERKTWVQGLAQLNRRDTKPKVAWDPDKRRTTRKSRLYEELVIPYISDRPADERWLDFGCGKGFYVKKMCSEGRRFTGLEFYNTNMSRLNLNKTRAQVLQVFDELRSYGLYDGVVCDSVLNSVDSVEAERSVVGTCNAMMREGGTLFISGRTVESQDKTYKAKKQGHITRALNFLDEDNFTAIYRHGAFFFQHFHSAKDVEDLLTSLGFEIDELVESQATWKARATKVSEIQWEDAVRFEFSLPVPGGRLR